MRDPEDAPIDTPSTREHEGPSRPAGERGRPVLIGAFPRPVAISLPDSGTVVGRAWLAERGVVDTEVSSAHFRVERAGGVLAIVDAGSRNGTWVNGARLSPRDRTPVEDGAVIRAGRTLFVFGRAAGRSSPRRARRLVGPYGLRASPARSRGSSAIAPPTCSSPGDGREGSRRGRWPSRSGAERRRSRRLTSPGSRAGVRVADVRTRRGGVLRRADASPGIAVARRRDALPRRDRRSRSRAQVKLLRLLENRECGRSAPTVRCAWTSRWWRPPLRSRRRWWRRDVSPRSLRAPRDGAPPRPGAARATEDLFPWRSS